MPDYVAKYSGRSIDIGLDKAYASASETYVDIKAATMNASINSLSTRLDTVTAAVNDLAADLDGIGQALDIIVNGEEATENA